ncbi:unnamed protein product [Chondrus crispus]|uniref:Uncharacterized protein n=1 Tax=Chondrus crispus TaxID=2769 RepID=R7Q9B3_CHOCR|nr:unnamed protein product [Chondrus crispus]CDF34055.1 unnamed protein product [Chondrus crispus]|eukprot:XP_005713874.1 unnamed protein product [Chondrus crispus]
MPAIPKPRLPQSCHACELFLQKFCDSLYNFRTADVHIRVRVARKGAIMRSKELDILPFPTAWQLRNLLQVFQQQHFGRSYTALLLNSLRKVRAEIAKQFGHHNKTLHGLIYTKNLLNRRSDGSHV